MVVPRPCRALYHHAGHRVAHPLRRIVAHPVLCRSHVATVSPGVSRHTLVAKPSSCHDTIVCIVTRLANQTARLSRYKDYIVTQPPTASPSLLSRYKTMYRDTLYQPSSAHASCMTPLRAVGHVVASLGHVAALPWPYRGRGWPCRGPVPCAQASLPSSVS